MPDKNGVTVYEDGTMFKDPSSNQHNMGGWLKFYDPNTGFWAGRDGIIRDHFCNATGDIQDNQDNANSDRPDWVYLLNSGLNTAASIWGNQNPNNNNQPVYMYNPTPVQPQTKTGIGTTGLVLIGIGVVGLTTAIVILVTRKKS